MKRNLKFCFLFLVLVPVGSLAAQPERFFLSNARPPVSASVGGYYQQVIDGKNRITETSVPLALQVPLGQSLQLSLLTGTARGEGQGLEPCAGFSDAQLGLSYFHALTRGSVVFSLGANLPAGKRALTPGAFDTAMLLGRSYYGFRVPGFGQGFNVSPGVSWAVPLGRRLVVGLGGGYQVRGAYRPWSTSEGRYDPGDEVLLTAGASFRLNDRWTASGDVSYTAVGSDALGARRFDPGNRTRVTAELLGYQGFDVIHLHARYRKQGESALQAQPDEAAVRATYELRVSRMLRITALAEGGLFGATDFSDRKALFELGAMPEFVLSENWSLLVRGGYTDGSFTGFEAGIGVRMSY